MLCSGHHRTFIQPLLKHAANVPFEKLDDISSVLGQFGKQSASQLASDLTSTNPNLRCLAIQLAFKFPTTEQKRPDWLTPFIQDPDKNIENLALTYWSELQPDTSAKLDLFKKELSNPDLQATAAYAAGKLKADANPLFSLILPLINKTTDDRVKSIYLISAYKICPLDSTLYNDLINSLHNQKENTTRIAIYALITNPVLREKSDSIIKQLQEDPQTPDSEIKDINYDYKTISEQKTP